MNRRISWIDIAIIILFVLSVYFILTRVFGHSASDLTISITLFTLLGGLVYKLNREFIKEDVQEIKNKV